MKKTFGTLAVMAAGLVAMPMSASAFVFDDFEDSQTDNGGFFENNTNTVGDWTISTTQVLVTNSDINDLYRTIAADRTGGSATGLGSTGVAVDGGLYVHEQTPGVFGQTRATWCVQTTCDGEFDISAWENLALQITVTFQDLIVAVPTLTFTLYDSANETLTYTFQLNQAVLDTDPAVLYSANFSSFTDSGAFDFSKFQRAVMLVDGSATSALDLQLDIIGVVPEPATLGLLGLGLLGLGAARRRRV